MLRKVFEKFAFVPEGFIVLIAILLVGLLCGQANASQVTSRDPLGKSNPDGSTTFTFSVIADEGETIKDLHLKWESGSCGGTPGPATGSDGQPLPGWTSSGGIGTGTITWRASGTNAPAGQNFTVTVTTNPNSGSPDLAPLSWKTTKDGSATATSSNTVDSYDSRTDPLIYGPKRKGGVEFEVTAAPPGGVATLRGYVGENEPRFYAVVFGLARADPPVQMGAISLLVEPSPILTLSLTPLVMNGIGRADQNGEFRATLFVPPEMPSGFSLYAALIVEDPWTLEWAAEGPPTCLEIR